MKKIRLKFRKSRLVFVLYSTIILLLFAAITSIIISTNASAFSGSGTGTALDPYLVTNCAQFDEVNNASSAYYKQTANIDCSGSSVTITSFSGNYDGQNYTISNIYLTSLPDPNPIGVFSSVSNGTIRNLNLTGITIVDNSQEQSWPLPSYPGPIGAFIGHMDGGTIDNCSVTGNINDSLSADYAWMEIAGGFVGLAEGNATFTDSHADVDISLSHETYGGVGGFVGQSRGTSSFSNNYAKGDISSGSDSYFTGGFVGWMVGNSTIDNSYANGNVHVGIGTPDDVLGYYGDNYDIGGFVGGAGGYSSYLGTISIDNCYSTGNVTAEGEDNYDIGGFAGTVYDGATVTNSFSYGNVYNPDQWGNAIGGFTGLTRDRYHQALPSISNCFSAGSVNVGDTLAWDVG